MDCSNSTNNNLNVNGNRLVTSDSVNTLESIDYNSLKLHLGAEFDDWEDFVDAVEDFQKQTLIRLTITTSRRVRDDEDEDEPDEEEEKQQQSITDSPVTESTVNGREVNLSVRKRKFQYKYIKLTCKHYGSYRSTSRGIRPNQATRKIKCPTYIYASLDRYRQRLMIKQMKVSCNHDSKDEQVLLPRLFKFSPCPEAPSSSNESSDCSSSLPSSNYKTLRNRKVALQSSVNALLSVGKIKCNHKPEDVCQASRLTVEDLTAIQSKFYSLSSKDQDDLLSNWIKVEKDATVNKMEQSNPLQLLIHLPTINGNLLPLCCDTFTHILSIPIQRINDLICEQLKKTSHREVSIKVMDEIEKDNNQRETYAATILHSLSKEVTQLNDDQIVSVNLRPDLNKRSNQNGWPIESSSNHTASSETVMITLPINLIRNEILTTETLSITEPAHSSSNNQDKGKEIAAHSSQSITNSLLITNNQSSISNFQYPSIKVNSIADGFSVDIDCDFEINLQGVSLINDSKTVKLIFEPQ